MAGFSWYLSEGFQVIIEKSKDKKCSLKDVQLRFLCPDDLEEVSMQRLVSYRIPAVLVWRHHILGQVLRARGSVQEPDHRSHCCRNKTLFKTECRRQRYLVEMVRFQGYISCLHIVIGGGAFAPSFRGGNDAARCSDQSPVGAGAPAAARASSQGYISARPHDQQRGYTVLWTQKIPSTLVSSVLLLDKGPL